MYVLCTKFNTLPWEVRLTGEEYSELIDELSFPEAPILSGTMFKIAADEDLLQFGFMDDGRIYSAPRMERILFGGGAYHQALRENIDADLFDGLDWDFSFQSCRSPANLLTVAALTRVPRRQFSEAILSIVELASSHPVVKSPHGKNLVEKMKMYGEGHIKGTVLIEAEEEFYKKGTKEYQNDWQRKFRQPTLEWDHRALLRASNLLYDLKFLNDFVRGISRLVPLGNSQTMDFICRAIRSKIQTIDILSSISTVRE